MAGPFARARERFAENHPVIAAGIRAAGREAADQIIASPHTAAQPADGPVIERAVEQAVDEQVTPVLANATNSEPWYQSRVIVGLIIAFVTMVARWLGLDLSISAADQDVIMQALPFFGLAISAIGRGVKNLPPIRWSRPWTLLGIGR